MMNILQKIFMAMLAVATPLLWSCSDGLEFDSAAPGAMSISLYSGGGNDATTSRANEGNVEFYIGKTHLYLYTSNDEGIAAKYHQVYEAGSDFTTRNLHLNLSDAQIHDLFGEGNTCYAYVVSNLPEDLDEQLTDTEMISTIKNFELKTDFSKGTLESFVMDGGAVITLNADNTMSGKISLQRAAVKLSLNVYIRTSFLIDAATYTPAPDSAEVELHNALSYGKIDKTVVPGNDDYIKGYSHALTKYWPNPISYNKKSWYWYTTKTFYTYPADWTNNNKSVNATICVPWVKTQTVSVDGSATNTTTTQTYKKYYYQIAIPTDVAITKLNRNYNYTINVYLSVLGSSLKTEYVTPSADELNFEITDWTDDGANITSSLDRNHYLVVQDNAFSLYNQDKLEIEYESCDDNVKPYVTEIKYRSTKDNKDYYIYATTYDQSTNSYTEDTERENYTSSRLDLDAIRANANCDADATTPMVTLSKSTTLGDSDSDNGYLVFNSPISNIAQRLYRPVIYTIVLANSKDHGSGRQTITITQYPSKYVEYGVGGNVFVNGYYAHVVPDANYTEADLPEGWIEQTENDVTYYQSYSFVYKKYSADKQAYYGGSNELVNESGIYGSEEAGSTTGYKLINTSYEFLTGSISKSTVKLENTIDVHVTAFSDEYHTFSINGSPMEYKIGDPRQKGSFVNYDHSSGSFSSGSYLRTGNTLYEYYTYGEKDGNTYYCHVSPWPDVDQIKIGGIDESYDAVIAPLFKIQSTYGTAKTGVYFDVAQKRCATYQEAGYPAGRWRLPTLAEIAFIVKLQGEEVIETMFKLTDDTRGYWTSSGGKVSKGTNTISYTSKQTSNSNFVRCVYDLWYWGDNQETPTHIFHPMPTKTTTKNVKRR